METRATVHLDGTIDYEEYTPEPEPIPEPEEEPNVYDELAAAYTEGVNSI